MDVETGQSRHDDRVADGGKGDRVGSPVPVWGARKNHALRLSDQKWGMSRGTRWRILAEGLSGAEGRTARRERRKRASFGGRKRLEGRR